MNVLEHLVFLKFLLLFSFIRILIKLLRVLLSLKVDKTSFLEKHEVHEFRSRFLSSILLGKSRKLHEVQS
jgi:hypothetical protein